MTVTITEVFTPVVLVEVQTSTETVGMLTPELAVIEVVTASQPVKTEVVPQSSMSVGVIDSAIRGEPGPVGPPGIQKVTHGSNPNVARPDVPLVYWVGSVQPVNANPDDLLMLKA
jgi:hypothetical protein